MKKLRYNTQYIDCYIQLSKITKKQFAKLCKIDFNVLRDIYKQKNMAAYHIINIVKTLKISADTFIFFNIKKANL